MPTRGRKKGSKNKHLREPHNFIYWKFILKDNKAINAFLERGSKQQKETIKDVLIYLKRFQPDFFEEVNGNEILERLK